MYIYIYIYIYYVYIYVHIYTHTYMHVHEDIISPWYVYIRISIPYQMPLHF